MRSCECKFRRVYITCRICFRYRWLCQSHVLLPWHMRGWSEFTHVLLWRRLYWWQLRNRLVWYGFSWHVVTFNCWLTVHSHLTCTCKERYLRRCQQICNDNMSFLCICQLLCRCRRLCQSHVFLPWHMCGWREFTHVLLWRRLYWWHLRNR